MAWKPNPQFPLTICVNLFRGYKVAGTYARYTEEHFSNWSRL